MYMRIYIATSTITVTVHYMYMCACVSLLAYTHINTGAYMRSKYLQTIQSMIMGIACMHGKGKC